MFPGMPLELFLHKAIKKAFKAIDPAVFALVNGEAGEGLSVALSQVSESTESFPVAIDSNHLAVHYTMPADEVVLKEGLSVFDIADDAATSSGQTLKWTDLKVVRSCRLSISFDVAKVDDQAAATFLQRMQFLLNDPEMMLL